MPSCPDLMGKSCDATGSTTKSFIACSKGFILTPLDGKNIIR